MVDMASKIKGALPPSACFGRAAQRASHALAELREAHNMVNVGYGSQPSQANRLIDAAEEILMVAKQLIERERDHHRGQEESRKTEGVQQ
jgi:hypothetical protein